MSIATRTYRRAARIMTFALALVCTSLSAGAIASAAPADATPAAQMATTPAAKVAKVATASEATSYAQRDKKAPADMAKFQGGDSVIYITTGTIALVLLIVILVILL